MLMVPFEGAINSMSDKHGFQCTIREQDYDREVICYFQKPDVTEGSDSRIQARFLCMD